MEKICKNCKLWYGKKEGTKIQEYTCCHCEHPKMQHNSDTIIETKDTAHGWSGSRTSNIYTQENFGCIHWEDKEVVSNAINNIYDALKIIINEVLISQTGKSLDEHKEEGRTVEDIKMLLKEEMNL